MRRTRRSASASRSIANHFKSKGCAGATGADARCRRRPGLLQRHADRAGRIACSPGSTARCMPAAGDPDVLLLGDFNCLRPGDPVTTLDRRRLHRSRGGAPRRRRLLLPLRRPARPSRLRLRQRQPDPAGHRRRRLAHQRRRGRRCSTTTTRSTTPGEAAFEEKPDGSALVPPRVVFQPASPYRAVRPRPGARRAVPGRRPGGHQDRLARSGRSPGTNLTYTITVTNNGPDAAAQRHAGATRCRPARPSCRCRRSAGWSCTTPAVGAGGTVSCSNPSLRASAAPSSR